MTDLVDCGLAVASGCEDSGTLLKYADALWTVRDTQAAIPILDRAIAVEPPLPPFELSRAYASRSICQLQLGSLDRALADVERSLEVMPRAHPLGLRALIYKYMGNIERAVEDAAEAVRLDPEDWELWAWRGTILVDAGRLEDAVADLTRVIDSGQCEKYTSELLLARARAEFMLGDLAAADADCDQCIDLDYHEQAHWPFIVPSRSRGAHAVYAVRAEVHLATGATHLALGDCFFAILLAPDDPELYDLRARVYYATGNLKEAMLDTVRAAHLRQRREDLESSGEAEAVRFVAAG